MNNFNNVLRLLIWLPVALVPATSYSAERNANSSTGSAHKDSGYHQVKDQQSIADLVSEIQALHSELRKVNESIDGRLKRIEDRFKLNAAKEIQPTTPAAPLDSIKPTEALKKSAGVLTVCSQGCDFGDLQKAVDAAMPGGEINVAPEINGTCAVINKPLHIIGKRGEKGERANLAGGVCNEKGPLVTAAANIVIEGFEISGVTVGDGNGACIRVDPSTSDLTIRDIYCHDSQDGILGKSAGKFVIEDSIFVGNGFGDGQAHGLYIEGDDVVIRRSQILSTQNAGHSLKSGARKLTVEDSTIAALNAHNSRAIDIYAGGEVILLRNVIQQGPQSDNSDVIGLALEPSRLFPNGHSLKMEGNWVIFDDSGRGKLLRGRKLGPIEIHNNIFVGFKGIGIDDVEDNDNHWFESRKDAGLPTFDGTPFSLIINGVGKK